MQSAGQVYQTTLGREVQVYARTEVVLCDRCDWTFPAHQITEVYEEDSESVLTLCPHCLDDLCQPGWGWIDGYREATKEDV